MKKPDNNYPDFNIKETKTGVKVTTGKPVIINPYKIEKGSSSPMEPPFTRGLCCEHAATLSIATSRCAAVS
jgi:hypothetical protein